MDPIVPERSWEDVLAAIAAAARPATAYIVGRSDSGKTTLARYLVDRLATDRAVGYLDGDPGQSSVGPPATIGLRIPDRAAGRARELLRFVGSVTPADHPAANVRAMTSLAAAARDAACDVLVVDSSGFVGGDAGQRFQRAALRSLSPDVLVIVDPGPWTADLEAADDRADRQVVRVPRSAHVRGRTQAERREYRARLFERYFRAATISDVHLGRGRLAPSFQRLVEDDDQAGRLLGLLDAEGFLLSLALLVGLDATCGVARVAAPPYASDRLSAVGVGSVSLPELATAWTAGAGTPRRQADGEGPSGIRSRRN
jgi:polynucleotide 5'-hydroxyl-kinase GRC3/NOL9